MIQAYGKRLATIVMAATFLFAGTAQADLQENLMVALNLFDYQTQIQRNKLGNGWDFDTAAYYGGQTFETGLFDLTLGETSPTVVRMSAGYTLRGLPSARFSLVTDSPLSYTLDANYGFQDFTATGNILYNIDTDINALGFYDMTFQVSNRGIWETDGFGPTDSGTLDFDIGPIVVSGNVFTDILSALTQPFFDATGTYNPFAKFSFEATKQAAFAEVFEDVNAKALAGEPLTDKEMGLLVNQDILASLMGIDPDSSTLGSLMLPDGLLDSSATAQLTPSLAQVPEPATLGLLSLALLAVPWRGKRR